MSLRAIALAGLLFASTTTADICWGDVSYCSESSPGYNHTLQNPIANGSFPFEGLRLDNSSDPVPQWSWELTVGNYSSGDGKAQIYEAYALKIPMEVEIKGLNVYHNVCIALLPTIEDGGKDDPGDCSTLFDEENIKGMLGGGAEVIASRNPCGLLGGGALDALGYEKGMSSDGGIYTSDGMISRGGDSRRQSEADIRVLRTMKETTVDALQADIDTSMRKVQPILIQQYPAIGDRVRTGERRLTCVHVQNGSGMRQFGIAIGSVLAWAFVMAGLLVV
ncbi:hypothetical protein AJ79_05052 [Helicocarpus griseus UAMH5409]|uniref:Uncharacterized protein n=1 Tax=Helicocarpus griseus UAMH5409 TaxID=1447875 RepID=A0A2B7XRI3_9EURO|nr:hypothetical protein AJ79_05052 [Helicocarpus griseus UAMH5409]